MRHNERFDDPGGTADSFDQHVYDRVVVEPWCRGKSYVTAAAGYGCSRRFFSPHSPDYVPVIDEGEAHIFAGGADQSISQKIFAEDIAHAHTEPAGFTRF